MSRSKSAYSILVSFSGSAMNDQSIGDLTRVVSFNTNTLGLGDLIFERGGASKAMTTLQALCAVSQDLYAFALSRKADCFHLWRGLGCQLTHCSPSLLPGLTRSRATQQAANDAIERNPMAMQYAFIPGEGGRRWRAGVRWSIRLGAHICSSWMRLGQQCSALSPAVQGGGRKNHACPDNQPRVPKSSLHSLSKSREDELALAQLQLGRLPATVKGEYG